MVAGSTGVADGGKTSEGRWTEGVVEAGGVMEAAELLDVGCTAEGFLAVHLRLLWTVEPQ